jgi:carboxyl-terminal processing protease
MINSSYFDEVNFDSITEVIMPMIMSELDPHSVYIPAQRFDAVNEVLEGGFGGIGVKFNMITDTALVINVIPGGPSERAGIEPGDRIMAVDSIPIAGLKTNNDEVMKLLRGKEGSQVILSILRQGEPALKPVTVTRGQVPVSSVTAAFELEPSIAYIKLDQFSRTSDMEIAATLDVMRSGGVDKLILDLRGNSGGYLDQAIRIANQFLPDGKLIVYTEDKAKNRIEEYSNGRGKFQEMKVAILIDEQSASSSEILAGAIQDNDRGMIIGRRSFGKGLVQEQVQFYDGSAVRLTIARYFTPTGRSIQKPYDNAKDYYMDMYERYIHNEYFSADSIHFADSLQFTTPGGRTVYGGGGIMPDIFVPLDTTGVNNFLLRVLDTSDNRNILYRYALGYADRHRTRINAIGTVDELRSFLDSDTDMFDDFVKYAATWGVRPRGDELEQSREMITARLRAQTGQNTRLDEVGYFANIYVIDNTILRAIEVLNGD